MLSLLSVGKKKPQRNYGFNGGIHPQEQKNTSEQEIRILPPPKELYIPLQQSAGAPSRPVVAVGDYVQKGDVLARALDRISAAVHASTSGTVVAIRDHAAPHPSGLPCPVVVLESDGKDEWGSCSVPDDPFELEPGKIAKLVEEAGVVGLGGASFPAALKLRQGFNKAKTLVINAAECEPYLTCDDRVMRERSLAVVEGIRLMQRALQSEKALIGIEDNKPEAAQLLDHAARHFDDIEVVVVPTRFPTGSGKQLIRMLTGKEVPANGRSHDVGVIIHNVSTAYAVHRAVRRARPLISRVVTVAGDAVAHPANLEIPIGTPVQAALDACGGLKFAPERLIMGGPMTGTVLSNTIAPVVKGTTGILALGPDEVPHAKRDPCIRCGRCVEVCPMGLVPLEMSAGCRVGDMDSAIDFGLKDCILCGSCAFVCPSHIPLVHYFSYGKGQLNTRRTEERREQELKQRAEARKERVEREKAEKAAAVKAAAAARRARRAAKKAKAEAEAKAQADKQGVGS